MADTKISALTSGNPALSGDLIPIARAGANYSITPASILAQPINGQGLGGFFSNGKINYQGGEASGLPQSSVLATPVNSVKAVQFSLVAAFKISRVSVNAVTATGVAALTLTSVANAAGGSTIYTGTITGGALNAWAGASFVIAGFVNGVNNGTFVCTASSATTLTLTSAAGVAETHAATATPSSSKFALALYDSSKNLLCQSGQFDGTNNTTGQTKTFTEVILPPGTYYFAATADNVNLTYVGYAGNNLRQFYGSIAPSGYIRAGISPNPYAAGSFPSSLGVLDGGAVTIPCAFWEVN